MEDNFREVPKTIRNKVLVKLADNESAAELVAKIIFEYFNIIPDKIRNRLLVKLADKDSAAKGVAEAVAENFDKLPDKVMNLLFTDKVQKWLEEVIEDLSKSADEYDRERAEKFKKFLK